jgi:hypothetical protein
MNLERRLSTKTYQGRLQLDDSVALQVAILIQLWIHKNCSMISKKENQESLYSQGVDLQASCKAKQIQNTATLDQKRLTE